MKRFRTLVLVAIITVASLTISTQAVEPARYYKHLDVRVQIDPTYRSTFGTSSFAQATTDFGWAAEAFEREWSLMLDALIVHIYNTPASYCSSKTTMCTDAVCGSPCVNDDTTSIHHKNDLKNFYHIANTYQLGSYDLNVALFAARFCRVGTTHGGGSLGLAWLNGAYVTTTNTTNYTEIQRVRFIQHELSHCFGCTDNIIDNPCSAGDCIMKGSYDTVPLSLHTRNIWCNNCHADFNVNAH